MVSAVFAPSDPYQPVKTRTYGQDMQHRGSSVEREGERRLRQGCQRLDRSPVSWEENAHARVSSPRGNRARGQHGVSIRRSGLRVS